MEGSLCRLFILVCPSIMTKCKLTNTHHKALRKYTKFCIPGALDTAKVYPSPDEISCDLKAIACFGHSCLFLPCVNTRRFPNTVVMCPSTKAVVEVGGEAATAPALAMHIPDLLRTRDWILRILQLMVCAAYKCPRTP